ncbi:MAG: PRC-barrel domain-containing protein, partial [Chloroflexi bacterium]|nr:PRC-barrel domain-containing protein [Chloroflexota bacterium]
ADVLSGGDDDAVYLQASAGQLDHLQAYAYGVNLAPPPADVDPETRSADLPQEPIDIPDVPPVGAAEGITTTAFTPILEVVRNLPEDSIVIDDGTVVSAADGNLGHVRSVLLDDGTRAVTGLLVRTGWVFTRDVEVPLAWVASIGSERITLAMDRAAVFAADEERSST